VPASLAAHEEVPHAIDGAARKLRHFISRTCLPLGGDMPQSETDLPRDVNPTEAVQGTSSLFVLNQAEGQGMFVSQGWHRLYAEALIESDFVILPKVIALAEQAVFIRFLELFVAKSETEEVFDLLTAIRVLAEIKAEVTNTNRAYVGGAIVA
jgi:hypothetical protein